MISSVPTSSLTRAILAKRKAQMAGSFGPSASIESPTAEDSTATESDFRLKWAECADKGECDGIDGSEYRWKYDEWVAAGKPADVESYISDSARSQRSAQAGSSDADPFFPAPEEADANGSPRELLIQFNPGDTSRMAELAQVIEEILREQNSTVGFGPSPGGEEADFYDSIRTVKVSVAGAQD